MRLKKSLVISSDGNNSKLVKQQIVEVTNLVITSLDWKLSACGIFYVDRRLLSGVIIDIYGLHYIK